MQTIDRPSDLWRLAISGGVPIKVLERVVLGNFMVLDQGIYYIWISPRVRQDLSAATSRPSERCSWLPSPLRMAAQFSMPRGLVPGNGGRYSYDRDSCSREYDSEAQLSG